MRHSSHRLALFAIGAAVAAVSAAPGLSRAEDAPSLTLFDHPGFEGRKIILHGPSQAVAGQGFVARSARSTGVWTLCDGEEVTSRCQTVNGAAPKLKLTPTILRPGVDAVALYEAPGLKGRRVIYSFASDKPPGFRPRSARTWGGPWSLCDARAGRCETIQGQLSDIDIDVSAVRPGLAPQRVQLAQTAAPRPAPRKTAPLPRLEVALAPPEPTPPPAAPSLMLYPPEPVQLADADDPPPPSEPSPPVAEDRPPEQAPAPPPAEIRPPPVAARDDDIYDVPLPPRQAEPVRIAAAAPPARPDDDGLRRVAYQCEDGRSLTAVFDDEGDTMEIKAPGEDPVFLQKVGAARGFRYEDRDLAFYGQRGEASYVSGDRDPLACWTGPSRAQFSAR